MGIRKYGVGGGVPGTHTLTMSKAYGCRTHVKEVVGRGQGCALVAEKTLAPSQPHRQRQRQWDLGCSSNPIPG